MKAINKKILFFSILFCILSLNVRADWEITGDAVAQGTQAVLTQSTDNSQEFVYVGKLTNRQFKITDGTKTYIHNCGDNDPLEQSITLHEQTDTDETGLRIRYVSQNQYFKVTLTVDQNSKKIIAEALVPPKSLYVMGGPFNRNISNWLLEDAVELERDADNPFVFYYKGDIRYNPVGDYGGSIKFLVGKSWSDNYHPAETGGDKPLNQAAKMRLDGEDNKWSIPADRSEDGYYVIKINTLDLTINIEQFTHNIDETPLTVFLTGEAMPCGWSNTAPMAMQKTQSGIYQWKGEVLQGQFKFLQRKGTWQKCYVATSPDEQVILGTEHNIIYEENYINGGGNDYKFVISTAGEYHFTLNLNTMKMRVEDPTTGLSTTQTDNGITFFSGNGKLFLKSEYKQHLQAVVFSIDGRKITQKTFVGNIEITLPKGCYLVLLSNKADERIASIRTLVY